MKHENIIITGDKLTLKLIKNTDIDEYFKNGFNPIDEEVKLYTGNKNSPAKEAIKAYVNKIIKDESRYDFLILNQDEEIIGESVINEIDKDNMSASFRIALFNKKNFGKGIGTEAIKKTLRYGFEEINLHRIGLEVFSFNERGYKAYKRAGFVEEGRIRDGEFINGKYHDIIMMGILKDEFFYNISKNI